MDEKEGLDKKGRYEALNILMVSQYFNNIKNLLPLLYIVIKILTIQSLYTILLT